MSNPFNSSVSDLGNFSGGREMGARIRAFDWSKTPLGPSQTWSLALRTMVRILLANRFPLLLWWGPQYVSIYNDAYRAVLGSKHPWALGQPVSECWKEIWHILQPLIDTPYHGGPAPWDDDIQLEIDRHGFVEETHFTIAYSPVPDESVPSGIGGVLATVHEITSNVLSERRIAVLRDLAARSAEAKTAEEACAIAAETLATHPKDIPFAAVYLVGPDNKTARLARTADLTGGSLASPERISLEWNRADTSSWPLAEAIRTEVMITMTDLSSRLGNQVPPGPWTEPPHTAVVIPISFNKALGPSGFLVAGVSVRLRLDDSYRDFLNLVSSQIASNIANAGEYEKEKKRAEAVAARAQAEQALLGAEQALRGANERFGTMADTAPVLIWENDVRGAVFVNRYFLEFLGVDFDELKDMGWSRFLHPEDAAGYLAGYQDAFARREPFVGEVRLRRADGEYRWILTTARPLGKDRFVGFSADITDRKRAEEELRESNERLNRALEIDAIGVLFIDSQGALVGANDAFLKMTGYSRADVNNRKLTWRIMTPPEWVQSSEEQFKKATATGRIGPYEKEYFCKDGSRRWFLFAGREMGDGTICEHCVDITERKRAEQALLEADKRKDEFLALLGHELRNPLAGIAIAMEALAQTTVSTKRARLEQIIVRQATLMRRLLDDLLDVSRITRGHVELQKEPIDASGLMRGAAAAVQKSLEDRGQELRLNFPAHSLRFMADPTRLDQIIGNLLSNASKYTQRAGRIELSVTLEGSQVVFCCKDNGQGIEPAKLETIFEAFVRGPTTELSSGEPSLGIGLALARQLTQLHGGTIQAASDGPGMGSEFIVRLPFVPPPGETRAAMDPEPGPTLRRSSSILMVDDNPDVAEVMKLALEQAGHNVYQFSDAASAISAGADLKADAVLLDIGLPDMNGYELAARLKQHDGLSGARFIAISGFKPKEQMHGDVHVFDHYVIKPVELPTLLALLDLS
jgi:PAS domain S-box-containing protein